MRRLLVRYHREGDRSARDQLVVRFLPLARHLARGYRGGANDGLTIWSRSLALGPIKALDRLDPESRCRVHVVCGSDDPWRAQASLSRPGLVGARAARTAGARASCGGVPGGEPDRASSGGCSPRRRGAGRALGGASTRAGAGGASDGDGSALRRFSRSGGRRARMKTIPPALRGSAGETTRATAQVETGRSGSRGAAGNGLTERERDRIAVALSGRPTSGVRSAARMGISQMHVSRLITRGD